MPIKDWPIEDRPIEKLLAKGERTLTEAELIAIFLKTGTRGKTALDLARELLSEYGCLRELIHAPQMALVGKLGIGKAKYASLKAAFELGRRYTSEKIVPGEVLDNSQKTRRFLADQMQDYKTEVFACLFLDTQLKLIRYEELFHGTVDETGVYPREIIKRCLLLNASKIILAHNHPSGCPEASFADKEMTELIRRAARLINVDVVDHIIVGHKSQFSFADLGLS